MKVWLITGASKGFGRVLIDKLLDKKEIVIGTSRDISAFKEIKDDNFYPLEIQDLQNESEVKSSLEKVIKKYGK